MKGKVYKPGMRLAVLLPDGRVREIPESQHRVICSGDGQGNMIVPTITPMTGYKVIVL